MSFPTGGQGAFACAKSRPENQPHKLKSILLHSLHGGQTDLEQGCDVLARALHLSIVALQLFDLRLAICPSSDNLGHESCLKHRGSGPV